jgi:ParB-like chromosome segregation protein Spo0J
MPARKKPVAKKPTRGPAPVEDGEDLFAEEPLNKSEAKAAKKGPLSKGDKNPAAEGKFGIQIRGTSKLVSPDDVKENIWNYNEQSDFVFEKLKQSIEEFGFTEPLTVRSENDEGKLDKLEIIGGAHRWKAAVALGMKKIPVNDVGKMSDATLKKFMIVLNETKGRPNNDQLAVVLSELDKDGIDLSVLPYDEAEIKSLTSMGDFDWNGSDVTTDLGDVPAEAGSEDADADHEWVGIEDVLDLEGLKSDDWQKDERYAKRLKSIMLMGKISPKSPWTVIDLLLESYYKLNKKKEVLPVDEDLEEGAKEEDEDDE